MAIWEKLFSKITFKDYPDTSTSLNADNLNKMTDAIDGIDDRVVELNSNLKNLLKWKLHKSQQGSVNISLTGVTFEELCVRVVPNDNQSYNQVFLIPKRMLTSTTISITSNYGQPLMVSFYADTNRIKLTQAYDETGADKTSSSTTFVYYR